MAVCLTLVLMAPAGIQRQTAKLNDDRGVLASTAYVVKHAQLVSINPTAVAAVAARLAGGAFYLPPWDATLHFADGTARTANYVLVLDALNFSFWGESRWRIEYHGRVLDGYWALAAALKRAVEDGVPLLEADYLAGLTRPDLAHILRGEGDIPLLEERLANVHEVGRVLGTRYGGRFAAAIEAAQGSALRLVRRIIADFASFDDVARYDNRMVRFYKRAQICVADLYGAFGGQQWGRFDDLDRLTAFADYKLPQIMRHYGILEYGPPLAERVDARVPIPAGSPEEVEIRAGTIWGVEYLRRALARRGRPMRAFELDWYLWDLSQHEAGALPPYHRTRTIFY